MAIQSVELYKARVAISEALDAIARLSTIADEITSCATTAGTLDLFLTNTPAADLTLAQAKQGLAAAKRITISAADFDALTWMRVK